MEDVLDRVVLEQLLLTLREDARIFVKERKPATSQEAAKLADDFFTAQTDARGEKRNIRGNNCKKIGHIAKECKQPVTTSNTASQRPIVESPTTAPTTRPKRDIKDVECFNCHRKGHYMADCPDNAYLCRERSTEPRHTRWVEGRAVSGILLDTGCSRTLVQRELVPAEKIMEGEAVAIRCAHGDTVLYPVARVAMAVGGQALEIEAAISDMLPMDVLLGTDVPELGDLLGHEAMDKCEGAMAVTTRAGQKWLDQEEQTRIEKESMSGATPKPVDAQEDEEWDLGREFAEDLFEGGRERRTLTRSEK